MDHTMEKRDAVRRQYGDATRLSTRIRFQQTYSVNPYGFGPWLMDQYDFPANARVLEIGCGTGQMWIGQQPLIDGFAELMLTDFSEGMLQEAQKNLADIRGVQYRIADIQNLPFADASYDFVIANMMLYHVPDRMRAIAEVRRVLKPGGTFVCATYGEQGIVQYLKALLEGIVPMRSPSTNFTLQNGAEQLRTAFAEVERRDYPDYFLVDSAEALVSYLGSLTDMIISKGDSYSRGMLVAIMQSCIDHEGGKLKIPKEYGTFVCR